MEPGDFRAARQQRMHSGWYLPLPELPEQVSDDWGDQAACKDADWHAFFPTGLQRDPADEEDGFPSELDQALRLCASCPVRGDCLLYALGNESDSWTESGIFGGMTPPERHRYRRMLVRKLGRRVPRVRPLRMGSARRVAS